MKRTAVLLLAALLLCTIGCGGQADDPNAVFVDPNAVRGGEYGELYFEVNGVRFGIYDEAAPVLAALSEEKSSFTRESCAFDKPDVFHLFDSFEIMTNEIDGVDRITAIRVTTDMVETPQGLRIGMRETEAAKAFPALAGADWNLVDGTALLSVTVIDGVVRGIVYTPAIADD